LGVKLGFERNANNVSVLFICLTAARLERVDG
jgi:hypothetical protein